ncbi:hypothetical protein NBRC116494_11390 [Aurantivibrio plasticivorans]
MTNPFQQLQAKMSFRQLIILVITLGIICLAIASSIIISTITERKLNNLLQEEGTTIAENFATQSTLALLYQSSETAADAVSNLLAFPSVSGGSIITASGEILFQQGDKSSNHIPNDSFETIVETENAWYFRKPVYAGNDSLNDDSAALVDLNNLESEQELAGFVEIVISKDAMRALSTSLSKNNLIVSAIAASLLLIALYGITNLVTKPIRALSQEMNRAERGDSGIRATLAGSKDIIAMEVAFNTMMETLESREDELKRARDTALASARVKGEFATTVSHELRTPMNGVMGMLELLNAMDLTEEQKEYINIARTSGEELLVLIDDILDFSKIESGKLKLHSSLFDPIEMVRGITELLSPQAQQKKLSINYQIDESVPKSLFADSGRIRQVLINLVGNAIKFTHQGNIEIRLSTTEQSTSKTSHQDSSHSQTLLKVEVEDSGIGIHKDAQEKIFEAFSQADGSTTREFGGTGLGLAICSQLIKLIGGKIGVVSEPNKGSCFWFTIPIADGSDMTPSTSIPDELTGMRVLIVSRSTDSCHSLINTFVGWEAAQRTTSHSKEALTLLDYAATAGKPYDVVVIDTPLPGGDEIQLILRIAASPKLSNIHVLLLSHTPQDNLPDNTTCMPKSPSTAQLEKTLIALLGNDKRTTEKVAATAKNLSGSKVLVVEDNKTNQKVAQGLLNKLGIKSAISENGAEALIELSKNAYDLVLMDCNMPQMNGYTASQIIRGKASEFQNIPIIALTAQAGPLDVNRCLTAGMNDYLSKPIFLDALREKLEQWLVGKHSGISESGSTHSKDSSSGEIIDDEDLDPDALDNLREQLGSQFNVYIKTYLEDTPRYIDNLAAALANTDDKQAKYFAQIIKGSASNLGARSLEKLCSHITGNISRYSKLDIDHLVDEIHATFDKVHRSVLEYASGIDGAIPTKDDKPRIMIVDDDTSSRIIMQSVLEKDGYIVTEVNNGAEAILACQESMPDLIIMDAMMPVMDGFTASERILSINSDSLPSILMITSLNDEGTLERAFNAGATDFILKPINMTILRQRVSRLTHTGHIDRHIHQLAYYDNLTSLPNRTFFVERSKNLLEKAIQEQAMVAVMFLDLDRFKLINESKGHEAGDVLLKNFSKRLEGCVRSADIVARLGGDEFTVVLSNINDRTDAIRVADKILEELKEPIAFLEHKTLVSSSIGIATFPEDGDTINELMKHADTAMFHAKAKGGKCSMLYSKSMESDINKQIELEVEIRDAIEHNQFELYYQPQIDARTGALSGMEALIRWNHPERGFIPPLEFIPFAEQSDLITRIGEWVLNAACNQQSRWLKQGFNPVPIAVNVSGRELNGSVLFNRVKSALERTEIPPSLIKLEITEDTLAECDENTSQHLRELKNLGTHLAIDDFGTGYSSLSYLKMFPVDTLKIDRSFVQDLPQDANSIAIISGIIALGHSLNLTIVAEGVETEEQLNCLSENGCDVIQGYYMSKPLPAQDLEQWIIDKNVHPGYANGNRG